MRCSHGGRNGTCRLAHRRRRQPATELSVVVPVYNATTLTALCDHLKGALQSEGISFELLFVNDGSQDESGVKLAELAKQHPEITIVTLTRNFGQATALLCGLASGVDCVVRCRSARAAIGDPVAVARATRPTFRRCLPDGADAHSLSAATLTSLSHVAHVLTGLLKDASMYVLMDRKLVDGLVRFPTRHLWVPAMIGCLGLPSRSVPVQCLTRKEGQSSYTSLARLRAALTGIACVIGYRLGTTSEPYLRPREGVHPDCLTRSHAQRTDLG